METTPQNAGSVAGVHNSAVVEKRESGFSIKSRKKVSQDGPNLPRYLRQRGFGDLGLFGVAMLYWMVELLRFSRLRYMDSHNVHSIISHQEVRWHVAFDVVLYWVNII